MVVEQMMPRFGQQNTRIINYHVGKCQWDESELDRLAKKLVPLLQECVPAAKAAIVSGLDPQAPCLPNIVGDHLPDDGREDGQRYSCWEREMISDRRAGYGLGEEQNMEWVRNSFHSAIRLIGLKFA